MAEENVKTTDGAAQTAVDTPKKKKMALWKKILIGVIVFIGAIVGIAFFGTRGASEAADGFIADLQAGNCSAIYTRTTDDFKDVGDSQQWGDACQRISAILQGDPVQKGVSVESNSGSDQTAKATYTIVGTDGITYGIGLEMVNRGGFWQLSVFDSDPLDSQDELKLKQN